MFISALGYSGNAHALSLADEIAIGERVYGGIEQKIENPNNSFVVLENIRETELSIQSSNKKGYPCSEQKVYPWDESVFRWSESVSHSSGSKELNEIYSGKASVMLKPIGILNGLVSNGGIFENFCWVPGIGVDVLSTNLSSQLDNENPDENDEAKATKSFITWTLSSEWRYDFDSFRLSLLFTHKSFDKPEEDVSGNFDRLRDERIVDENLNVLSYVIAHQSNILDTSFKYYVRGLWNVWQTAPHPFIIVESHFDKDKKKNYQNHLGFEGKISYSFLPNVEAYSRAQLAIPNRISHSDRKIQRNLIIGARYGMFNFLYERSEGRPDGYIVPNIFGTDSNNSKFLIEIRGTWNASS